MSRIPISPEETRLLLMARPLQAILRPGVRGHDFRLAGETLGTARCNARFSEALVVGMVARGLLTITQCAKDLPVFGKPGETFDIPFACIMSKDGVEQRAYAISDRSYQGANDTGALTSGAAA